MKIAPFCRESIALRPRILCVLFCSLGFAHYAHAQNNTEFADDFSVNTILYSSGNFDEAQGSGTATVVDNNIVLRAQQVEGSDYGNVFVQTLEDTDSFIVTAAFDAATSLPSGNNQETATLTVEERIYNNIADGGNNGDVQVNFDIGIVADGTSFVSFCIGEQTNNGYQSVNVFDAGNNNCSTFSDVTIEPEVDYTFGFRVDKASNELTLVLNENTRTVTLPGTLYRAENSFTVVNLTHRNGSGFAQARISSITTDSGTDTISNATSIGRYNISGTNDDSSVTWNGEKLVLTGRSTEDSYDDSSIRMTNPTDYLEAIIEISSDTSFGTSGGHYTELRADLFNDTANGGFNGREGDVTAFITFGHDNKGQQLIEYCLRREDDAEGNARTGLLADGDRCRTVPIRLELDAPYRASIDFNREQSSVTYRINGFTHTQDITSGIFDTANKSMQVGTYPNGIATIKITVDDVRSAPEALTSAEQAAGATEPTAFPPAVDPASLVADSTLTIPVFDQDRNLDFIDDFSTPTMQYGFWDGRDRGEVAIGYSPSGYVEIQANASSGDDNNNGEFYVDGPTDMLQARLSLASTSELPISEQSAVQARLQGTFYNDMADGGVDGQLGDVYVSLSLRLRGHGRRDGRFYMERRNAEGSREEELFLIPDGENVFENFSPELDTEYTLTLLLDRENRTLTASINEFVQVIDLPTDVFSPARSDKQVQISYNGESGHGVGRIHAISTDLSTVDFAVEQPLLGLYRPAFNADYPGIETVHEDGRVRLVADSNQTQGRGADLQARGSSDYLAATMLMSSDTTVSGDGAAAYIGIGGFAYNDLADGGTDGALGSVFATLALGMKAADNGAVETFVEYCAFRSLDSNFGDSEELIGGDTENCPRFAMPAVTDVSYDMSIALDREARTITYTVADEVQVYAITTDIFNPSGFFNGARARSGDGGIAIGYADNLSYSATPVALADSNVRLLVTAAATDSGANTDTDSGDGTGNGNGNGTNSETDSDTSDTSDTGNTGGILDDATSTSSGGSSGGCSIASENDDPLLPLMGLLAGLIVWRRRVA